ncbi:MAG: YjjG family noncanonical pyrimidine nucleotidase [Ilumatobacteraceae bacterium]
MTYECFLFDLDHTLLDSDESERLAFRDTMRFGGIEDPDRWMPHYLEINRALWKRVEAGELRPQQVRVMRFEQLAAHTSLSRSPEELGERFAAGLGGFGELYPGARELLDDLARRGITMALVTNGLSEVQRARIERLELDRYFTAVTISAEAGISKPDPAFFLQTMDALGSPSSTATVVVGDSQSADVAGAHAAGLDACWYNPTGALSVLSPPPRHVARTFAEIAALAS